MNDPGSKSHQNKSLEIVRDLSGSFSKNSNQDRHLRHSEHQIIPHQIFEFEGDAILQSRDILFSSSPNNDEPRSIKESLSAN